MWKPTFLNTELLFFDYKKSTAFTQQAKHSLVLWLVTEIFYYFVVSFPIIQFYTFYKRYERYLQTAEVRLRKPYNIFGKQFHLLFFRESKSLNKLRTLCITKYTLTTDKT